MNIVPTIVAILVLACLIGFTVLVSKNIYGLRDKCRRLIDGDRQSHVEIKRHRSKFLFISSAVLIVIAIIASLSIGPTKMIAPWDAAVAAVSSLIKGGNDLNATEFTVYHDRLPRTLATIAVGIGLSIAGCVYQAIIRNPLVDPYIMGVSSGAGTAAIAVIAFEFTFFGLMSPHSPYLTAVTAIVGGLFAFTITAILAEKAGGRTNSYVLSGVIVGLIFGAIQTVMMTFAQDKVNNALMWLFGSFSSVNYQQVVPLLIVSLVLSFACMKWAKELNLVLLGENQARQMGLNVRRFNLIMLIIASVLTSVCVAFVGIIGFVGLVVPHLCRMVFGGDHRLVMPASVAFGAILMMAADICARIIVPGQEMPVGAITTLVGVPVFAYLLYKKGKIYNG